MSKEFYCGFCKHSFSGPFVDQEDKCPNCKHYLPIRSLHPLGTQPIDFSEMNMDDPSVLRMYFGSKRNKKDLEL